MQTGEFNEARKIYEKLVKLGDIYYRGHVLIGLGNIAEKQKDSALAEDDFKKAKQLFFDNGGIGWPEYNEACVQLANFYTAEKRYPARFRDSEQMAN